MSMCTGPGVGVGVGDIGKRGRVQVSEGVTTYVRTCRSLTGADDLRIYPLIYSLSPQDLGHVIRFNTSIALGQLLEVPPDRFQRQVSPRPLFPPVQFTCGFVNGSDRRQQINAATTIVISQQGNVYE